MFLIKQLQGKLFKLPHLPPLWARCKNGTNIKRHRLPSLIYLCWSSWFVKGFKKSIRCPRSRVVCCVLPVTCCMSLMPTATATDPPPANSSNMHSRMLLLILTQAHQQWVAKTNKYIFNPFWAQIPILRPMNFRYFSLRIFIFIALVHLTFDLCKWEY